MESSFKRELIKNELSPLDKKYLKQIKDELVELIDNLLDE